MQSVTVSPGSRVQITAHDVEFDETETFDATVVAIDSTGILVAPDDTLMGLTPTIFISREEIAAASVRIFLKA